MPDKGTEQATPQRKKKAREQGDSVHSRELLSAMAMLGGIMVLGGLSNGFVSSWGKVYAESLSSAMAHASGVEGQGGEQLLVSVVRRILIPALMPVGLVMAAAFTGALVSGVAQSGGVQIHPKAVQFKFSKLNPVTNLGNLFSLRSATRLVKSLVPASVMVILGWGALKELMVPRPGMSFLRLSATFSTAYGLAVEELESAAEDEQAGDSRRDAGCDGQSADQGEGAADSTGDAQAQGEGGHVAGERGDHEPNALCGGVGVQLRDDVGADGAG